MTTEIKNPYEAKIAIIDGKLRIELDMLKMIDEGADHIKIPMSRLIAEGMKSGIKLIKVEKKLDLIKDAEVADAEIEPGKTPSGAV